MSRIPFIASAVMLVFSLALKGSDSFATETSVANAVLQGNWEKVMELLKKDDTKAEEPVSRLLMAHASLATNRNNPSMALFLSVREAKDLKAWSDWTEALVRRYPQNPVALYLSADATARQGKWKEAAEGFTQAIKKRERFAMAYNARGVVRLLTNEWDEGLSDFLKAIEHDPQLADGYANLGAYWVMRESPEGAIEAFNQALAINAEFALAYNGRGCAYFGQGRFEIEADQRPV